MINRVGNVARVAIAFVHRVMGMSVPLPKSVEVVLPTSSLAIVRNGMNMREFSGTLEKTMCTRLCLPL